MRRRWKRWQVVLIIVAAAVLLWGATRYDNASKSLADFSRRIEAVGDWLCPKDANGKRGECDFDDSKEADAPTDDLHGLQASMDALPLGWATSPLFPATTTLCIPGGQRASLSWPASADDRERVMTGQLALLQGTMSVTSSIGSSSPVVSRRRLDTGRRTLRVAVATTIGAVLELSCLGSSSGLPCHLVLSSGSGDLPRDGQC